MDECYTLDDVGIGFLVVGLEACGDLLNLLLICSERLLAVKRLLLEVVIMVGVLGAFLASDLDDSWEPA